MRVIRGILGAIRGHPRVFFAVALAWWHVHPGPAGGPVRGPAARRLLHLQSLAEAPAGYVLSPTVPLGQKLEKLPALALFWFSSDSPYGGTDWGFAVDVTDVARILLLAGLFGAYFALLARRREASGAVSGGRGPRPRGGVAGMLTSVVGSSTGPCSVMGCGAPVIPSSDWRSQGCRAGRSPSWRASRGS